MNEKNNKSLDKQTKDILTNAPHEDQYTIRTDVNPKELLGTTAYYAGDSVNEHKELEEANQIVGEEEVKQQNENL